MNGQLLDSTKIAAYFLWDYTHHQNALELWYCAEDIASYMERLNFLSESAIVEILKSGTANTMYIGFMRNIAYRIHLYTGYNKSQDNWYTAERLVYNYEWRTAILKIAQIFNSCKLNKNSCIGIRSESIREYYKNLH